MMNSLWNGMAFCPKAKRNQTQMQMLLGTRHQYKRQSLRAIGNGRGGGETKDAGPT